ncbi:hypothetical protein R1T16_04710 [Flavobacterium sp. DG1-102-2]|uniref:hypothetical protein n=1 Tax=Flavobacterium sp. DG1-102-2 TaxID=3081663 RepID=UPI00294A84E8|nr:hypothetical protein [Flavobacterium sp. DG1-102-2]MDV6167714.1 hypothetical protein [Flavobacterium sp. DG1-102-2]
MKKLTPEQIEHIDDELFYIGIEYVDIRYEMVDHIASVLEEKQGDFEDNFEEYFIMNRLQLIKQYRAAKLTAIVSAIKFYLKTMLSPVAFLSGSALFLALYFGSVYYIDDRDITMFGSLVWFIMTLPLFWLGRDHKKISVLRPMVLLQTVFYFSYQTVIIASYSIGNRVVRTILIRISASLTPALMLVLLISLYRYRKQYAKQYI